MKCARNGEGKMVGKRRHLHNKYSQWLYQHTHIEGNETHLDTNMSLQPLKMPAYVSERVKGRTVHPWVNKCSQWVKKATPSAVKSALCAWLTLRTGWLTTWMNEWMTDWTDWLTHWLSDWPINVCWSQRKHK